MGIVFLARSPKQEIMAVCTVETGWFLGRQLFSMENESEKQRKNR